MDVELLTSQTIRCRNILAELAALPEEEDASSPFARLSFSALAQAVAGRHEDGRMTLDCDTGDGAAEPLASRRSGIVHGPGNLVQNAIQFACEKVVVQMEWGDCDHSDTRRRARFSGSAAGTGAARFGALRPGRPCGDRHICRPDAVAEIRRVRHFRKDAQGSGAVVRVSWRWKLICDEDGGDERYRQS